jgi:hypothetical protein
MQALSGLLLYQAKRIIVGEAGDCLSRHRQSIQLQEDLPPPCGAAFG